MSSLISRFSNRGVAAATELWQSAVDFAYPPHCGYCNTALCGMEDADCPGTALCDTCRDAIVCDAGDWCQRCGQPVGPYLDTSNGCANCHRSQFSFDSVVRLGLYDGRLREACIRGKSPGSESLAAALAHQLWKRHQATLEEANLDLIIPVPQHWTQRITRPHNQALTLAQVFSRRLQVEFSRHILCKIRRTPDQSSLTAQQRRVNQRGAFRVRGVPSLAGLSVLLVDDILTTGTTANESSKVLRRAGAKRVVVAVAAVVPNRPH